jgi:hypothetical protein
VGKKQARLYKSGVSKALTAKQLLALKDRILKFGERIAAHAKNDVIAPRAISPAETS